MILHPETCKNDCIVVRCRTVSVGIMSRVVRSSQAANYCEFRASRRLRLPPPSSSWRVPAAIFAVLFELLLGASSNLQSRGLRNYLWITARPARLAKLRLLKFRCVNLHHTPYSELELLTWRGPVEAAAAEFAFEGPKTNCIIWKVALWIFPAGSLGVSSRSLE